MESLVMNQSYTKVYQFELYDFKKWDRWMIDYWHWSVYASLVYVGLLYLGRKWMEIRTPFELRGPLILWNLFLSIGSFIMFSRLYPELVDELKNHGVYQSICNRERHTITHEFWLLIFTLSKIVEFGDTAFIILRKQKLIFLHWYHHITVAMYCFYVCGDFDPSGRWFSVINTFIHTVMYGYYALKAMRIHVPKKFAMVITSMQILQMVVGLVINLISLVGKASGEYCVRPYDNICWALLMYASYFALFVNFFKQTYGKKTVYADNKVIKKEL